MQKEYPVYFNENKIGKATIHRSGLYYEIFCECNFHQKQIYRLYAKTELESACLGVFVPEGYQYRLRKKIPVKRFAAEGCTFYAASDELFAIIDVEKPFPYLEEIEKGKLTLRDQIAGITFTGLSPALPGNDQSP